MGNWEIPYSLFRHLLLEWQAQIKYISVTSQIISIPQYYTDTFSCSEVYQLTEIHKPLSYSVLFFVTVLTLFQLGNPPSRGFSSLLPQTF